MKNSKRARIFGMFLSLIMAFSMIMPMSIFAANITYTDGAIKKEAILCEMLNKSEADLSSSDEYNSGNVKFTSAGDLIVSTKGQDYTLLKMSEPGVIVVDVSAFKNAKQSDVTKAMRAFTDAISGIDNANADTVQQIMNDLQEVDSSVASVMLPLIFEGTKGDMFSAYKITSPFLNIFSVILGIGAVGLIILLFGSTVIDLAYIGLPVWREAQASKDGGNKHPFGVSYEALRTVTEIEQGFGGSGGGEYKNAYLLYFKRRALTYIVLAICIMYLICGGLSGIIGWVLSLVSGITG